jgi:hypothetical protein
MYEWEKYGNKTVRLKVDGGYLYETIHGLCFVPDVDLTRYQSHLRDAYRAGYRDGHEDAKNGVINPEEGTFAYPDEPYQNKSS